MRKKNIENYGPVSLLNMFSKIYERFMHKNVTSFVNSFLSEFSPAIQISYSTNYVLINNANQKQQPEVLRKKSVLKTFSKFTGKHLRQSLFFNKVLGLSPATFLKKRLWYRPFPVNFAKFLKAPLHRLRRQRY